MIISAIVPAYNEGERIHNVLKVLTETELINEIIVVNDGSNDRTYDVSIQYTKFVIDLKHNVGKGGAIIKGIEKSNGNIILLLDADLIGLTSKHIVDMLNPIILNEADTTVGIFSSGRFFTDLAQKIAPFLSGQRVIKRDIFNDIHTFEITKYGFEVALSNYVKKKKLTLKTVILHDMSHVMKEEKEGLLKGFLSRLRMYWQIVKVLSFEDKR